MTETSNNDVQTVSFSSEKRLTLCLCQSHISSRMVVLPLFSLFEPFRRLRLIENDEHAPSTLAKEVFEVMKLQKHS